jgi:hypothetical protein
MQTTFIYFTRSYYISNMATSQLSCSLKCMRCTLYADGDVRSSQLLMNDDETADQTVHMNTIPYHRLSPPIINTTSSLQQPSVAAALVARCARHSTAQHSHGDPGRKKTTAAQAL